MLKAGAIWAVGAMSGTSLDGVDAAMLLTDGQTISAFGRHAYRPYEPAERDALRAALGQWPGDPAVEAAAEAVETAHAEVLCGFADADLIGFHGQTLAHDPGGRGTHQVGSGAVLAEVLGKPVVWDFRSADVRLGGQGAPLTPFFHFACAKWAGLRAPVAFVNLGGVGNVTWVDPSQPGPEVPGACLAFDTGPANAPVNDLMRARLGRDQDDGGALAATGRADETLIAGFLQHPYFFRIPPKSLDRNAFTGLGEAVAGLSDADACATLTAAAAAAVARSAEHFPAPPSAVHVCGGGRLNRSLMVELTRRMRCPVGPVEDIGINGDMLEAQAFAWLAVRVARGLPTSGPSTTGVSALVGGGQISRPAQPSRSILGGQL